VRVRDPHQDPAGRVAFFREPRTARSDLPQPPTCSLNVTLPGVDQSATGGGARDAGKIFDDEETESRWRVSACWVLLLINLRQGDYALFITTSYGSIADT